MEKPNFLITGGSSMIGGAIIRNFYNDTLNICAPSHSEYDLLSLDDTLAMFRKYEPKYVIHAAGYNGGIEFNRKYPADIYYRTVQMGLNVLECCRRFNVKKVLSLISSCAYPNWEVLPEGSLHSEYPNETVECHAFAKRTLDEFSRQISKQNKHTLALTAVLTNCYGPHDSFNPEKTKVVGGLVKRIVDAVDNKLPEIVCWGDGSPLRELMYEDDAGRAIVQTFYVHDTPNKPVNIGTNKEISIKALAELIAEVAGYKGEIKWDTTKANGQMRKMLDSSRMRQMIEWSDIDFTEMETGLRRTVQAYKEYKCKSV